MSIGLRLLRGCALFQPLSEAEREQLARRCLVRRFPSGTSIYVPGDEPRAVCLLVTGRARFLHVNESGRQSILGFVEPGELFGEQALCRSDCREEFCEAAAASTVVLIPVDDVREVLKSNAELGLRMLALVTGRRRKVERRLKNLLFHSHRQRLIHALLELLDEYGRPESAGVRITLAMSHEELGSLIGATRETVTLTLAQLRNEGLIRATRTRRELVILDPDGLRSAAASTPQARSPVGVWSRCG